ncbi:helix-turn-helix domain-containing protein [Clostridium sp. 19966]|uniref:helix-turn-helix domain-containing protein n=1 Tax=Clostridium sp. 19966 TaxID=2768166 RepID=UPI0028DDD029|nr:helix-turn-helix domain-containing protein [Clostridium sp. 19966]MDT8718240.1 helix-turn-helix domain-containing protein [Clostridium sp. 19966]
MTDSNLIKTTELCEWLQITPSTALRWRNEGMPFIGKGKVLRYNKKDVKEWLDKQNKKENKEDEL